MTERQVDLCGVTDGIVAVGSGTTVAVNGRLVQLSHAMPPVTSESVRRRTRAEPGKTYTDVSLAALVPRDDGYSVELMPLIGDPVKEADTAPDALVVPEATPTRRPHAWRIPLLLAVVILFSGLSLAFWLFQGRDCPPAEPDPVP